MARKRKQEEPGRAGFGQETPSAGRSRLTPVEIQQKVFRLAFRGYNERDVDEFLDHVTEDLAALHEENKRLREQVGGGGGGEDLAAARSQAESIVREAREHAARLIEDTGPSPGSGGGSLSASFLLRERDFLQRMAQSVQEHARWLKEEAQRQRSAAAPVAAAVPVKTGKPSQAAKKASPGPAPKKSAKASAGEATAAWGPPQEGMGDPSSGLNQDRSSADPDPLLSAWESAFTGEAPDVADGQDDKAAKEGQPSLRELFWGEE